ncbi:MAG: S41 family peptidase [Planctomycetota bacterium]|nr:S41 family peptidase [Planctomycetota bacterium]
MHRQATRLALVLVSLCLLCLGAPILAQNDAQAEKLVDSLAGGKGDSFWRTVRELEALGDKALPALEKGIVNPDPFVRVGAAKAIFALGRKKDGVHTLTQVVGEKNRDAQVLAAETLAAVTRGATEYGDAKEIEDQLVKQLDSSYDRPFKIALCKAINSVANGSSLALRELKNFLDSGDQAAQEEAALALAEMDNFEPAMDTLKRLAQESSPNGRLAKALLDIKTLQDKQLRDLQPAAGGGKYPLVDEVINHILGKYVDAEKITRELLIEGAAEGIANKLDVFSEYLNEKRLKRLTEDINLEYGGIGAHVSMRDDILTIERPIYNGPAYRAGLKSLDRVVEVEGIVTQGKTVEELVGKLRGKPGTPVKIKVSRRGWEKPRDFEIVREEIKIPTAKSEMLPNAIGYLQLTSFSTETPSLVGEGIAKLLELGAKGFIIDLRNNSGGVLAAPRAICEYFLERGKVVVTTREKGGVISGKYETRDDSNKTDLPLVVLVNYGSASASEILAGALQDHDRATVIGERTYGKGSVQHIIEMRSTRSATALRLTTAKYYLPSGRTIEKQRTRDMLDEKTEEGGILPDIVIEPPKRNYWKDEHLSVLLDSSLLDKYVTDNAEQNAKKFTEVAMEDGLDHSKYPGFDAFYEKIQTELNVKLDKNDVREALRERIRRHVSDKRGQEFLTDLQEDVQLQRAVIEMCNKLHEDPKTIAQFKLFAEKFNAPDAPPAEK